MTQTDPQREFAIEIVQRLTDAGYLAYWAGGCVRDLLLGIAPKDYDVATDAIPNAVRKLFGRRRTQAVGAVFGVIIVHGGKDAGNVEVATFRTDGSYHDGRRPETVEYSIPQEDAKRRDFTINGMFYDPLQQKVFDFVGGEKDLKDGTVRAIGNPHDRMNEDKLRLMRAVRFTAAFEFTLEESTAEAIREMADGIHAVSAERISQELHRILVDRHRRRAVELLGKLGLLQKIYPEFLPFPQEESTDDSLVWGKTLSMLQLLQEPRFETAAAVLFHAISFEDEESLPKIASGICRRRKFSNKETDLILWLLKNRKVLGNAPELKLSTLKRLMAHEHFGDLLALTRVGLLAENLDLNPVLFCEEFLRNTPWEEIDPPVLLTGDDLIVQGYRPSAQFREVLDKIRDAQLEGEISTKREATKMARQMFEKE